MQSLARVAVVISLFPSYSFCKTFNEFKASPDWIERCPITGRATFGTVVGILGGPFELSV